MLFRSDPIVRFGDTRYTLNGGGSGYHNYQLRYDGGVGLATLWIDGTERLTGLTATIGGGPQNFSWGGGQNPYGTLAANWSEASFTIVPEPSSLVLLGLGGSFLFTRLARKSRSRALSQR